jgi:hypothetical protein
MRPSTLATALGRWLMLRCGPGQETALSQSNIKVRPDAAEPALARGTRKGACSFTSGRFPLLLLDVRGMKCDT